MVDKVIKARKATSPSETVSEMLKILDKVGHALIIHSFTKSIKSGRKQSFPLTGVAVSLSLSTCLKETF